MKNTSGYSSFNQVEYQSSIGIPTIFCDMRKTVICETSKTFFFWGGGGGGQEKLYLQKMKSCTFQNCILRQKKNQL